MQKAITFEEKKNIETSTKTINTLKKTYDYKLQNEIKYQRSLFSKQSVCLIQEEAKKTLDPLAKSSNIFLTKNVSVYEKSENINEIIKTPLQIENESLKDLIIEMNEYIGFFYIL